MCVVLLRVNEMTAGTMRWLRGVTGQGGRLCKSERLAGNRPSCNTETKSDAGESCTDG